MQVMVLVKASAASEGGAMPSQEMLTKMGQFNEELLKAGVVVGMNGLHPSKKGKRLRYGGAGGPTVIDGPFAETKELVGGYWIWKVRDLDEAVAWLKRAPFEPGAEVELRPIFALEDFGANLTPEVREQEARIVAEMKKLDGAS